MWRHIRSSALCVVSIYNGVDDDVMSSKVVIRNERSDDTPAITTVAIAAFRTLEISSRTEHFIVEALCAANALTASQIVEAHSGASDAL